jgi:hypothetical protein
MVLLLHSASADAEAKAEALGKRTIRWDALRPSAEEARVLLSEARDAGTGPAAQAVLDRVGVQGMEAAMALKAGLRALSKADEALAEPAASRVAPADDRLALERAQQFAASMAKAKAEQSSMTSAPPVAPPRKARKFSPILLVGLFALSASAAITVIQQLPPGFLQTAQEGLQSLVGMEPEGPATTADPVPADAPVEVGAKTLGPMPERLTDLEIQQDPSLRAQQAELTVTQPIEVRPVPETPKASTATSPPASKSVNKPVGPVTMTDVSAGWYVQHLSRDSRQAVEQFFKSNPKLSKARMLRLKRIGAEGDNWVLLSGPFKSIDDAKAFMKTPGLSKDMWVRPASAIRKMLPDASGGAGA